MMSRFDAIRMKLDRMNADSAVDYPEQTAAILASLAPDIDDLTAEDLRTEFEHIKQTINPNDSVPKPENFRSAASFFAAVSRAMVRLADTLDGARQPAPNPNDGPRIWDLVIGGIEDKRSASDGHLGVFNSTLVDLVLYDMRKRDRLGRERYGMPLQANNGRDALRDMYEEKLDACAYARQAKEEGLIDDSVYIAALRSVFDVRLMMVKRDAEKDIGQ